MIKFYDVDKNYVEYLQTIDRQIPNISYSSNNKFVCGVVLNINGFNYYAPVSHNTEKYRTSFLIFNKHNKIISSIRFCFMFPAPFNVLTEKNFRIISSSDNKYTDLLAIEYEYCILNENKILNKAKSVYDIGCNKNHKFNYTCCDFKLLENKMDGYGEYVTRKEIAVSKE